MWEASDELRAELDPAFARYLARGPRRTGRLPLPGGGSAPIKEIAGANGADYCVVPLNRLDGPRVRRCWMLGSDWQILEYRPGYALAILDPMLAGRVLDVPTEPPPSGP